MFARSNTRMFFWRFWQLPPIRANCTCGPGCLWLFGGGAPREGKAFPAVLEEALRKEGYNVTIVNAGVSGETAPGGLTGLEWTIGDGASGAILELGANDMLGGMDLEVTKAALDEILARFSARGIKVLIAGMKATPSHGPDYKT